MILISQIRRQLFFETRKKAPLVDNCVFMLHQCYKVVNYVEILH